jgi:hypothetical protein
MLPLPEIVQYFLYRYCKCLEMGIQMVFLLSFLFFVSNFVLATVPFITNKEKSDLEIERLVLALDSTHTRDGRRALGELLEPTGDLSVIKERQALIQLLLEDDTLYDSLENWLLKIKSCEPHITSYLERKPDLLGLQSESLYFQPLLDGDFFKKIANFCNKSSLILEGSILKQLWNSFSPIIFQLGAAGVAFKYNQWLFEGTDHFEYWEGFKLGLKTPIKNHSWTPYTTKERVESHDQAEISHQLYTRSLFNGSLRDRFEIFKDGMVGRAYFNRDWYIPVGHSPMAKPLALFMALFVTACSDIVQGFSIVSAWKYFTSQYTTIQELKKQLYYLRQYLDHVNKLSEIIHISHNATSINDVITTISLNNKTQLKELRSYLSKSTFNSPDGYFYRRGLVLWLHKKISHYFKLIDQLTSQVGMIDAYMSIARCIKKLQAQNLPVCFASFTEIPNSCIITDGWILTTPHRCVQNSIELGGHKSPRAIVLSGPHGCGKSTILTLLGHTAMLTHSVGIGFASQITISQLEGIRTSFSTDSAPEKGLSTFMAAQQSMQRIEQFMDQLNSNQTGMILLSEPYKGTVEAEATYRINRFCTEHFVKHPTMLMALETHVAGPMMLAQEFPDCFANKHMSLNLLANGEFERTFLLTDGAADWWFENNELRSRYVDWINDLVRKKVQ